MDTSQVEEKEVKRAGAKKMTADEYRMNLRKRHGKEFLNDLDRIFKGETTLSRMSRHYNLSKMRITQIFERVYGLRLRDVIANGFVEDSSGAIFNYKKEKEVKMNISITESLYKKLKKQSKVTGIPMSEIIRGGIYDIFHKDGMSRLHSLYF